MVRAALGGQRGLTLVEVLVAIVLLLVVIGSLSTLVGAAFRGKMIVAVRSADTETARQTLEWMSERLRNAGLNILPSAQPQDRCKDMVVVEPAALRPTPSSVYVTGEILNTNETVGDEVITLGYRLSDGVVVEDRSGCAGPWFPATAAVSNPRIAVTTLQFRYFARNGSEVVVPTADVEAIRSIRVLEVTLVVQGQEGRSGAQAQTFTRLVMLRNPRPDASLWINTWGETNP